MQSAEYVTTSESHNAMSHISRSDSLHDGPVGERLGDSMHVGFQTCWRRLRILLSSKDIRTQTSQQT